MSKESSTSTVKGMRSKWLLTGIVLLASCSSPDSPLLSPLPTGAPTTTVPQTQEALLEAAETYLQGILDADAETLAGLSNCRFTVEDVERDLEGLSTDALENVTLQIARYDDDTGTVRPQNLGTGAENFPFLNNEWNYVNGRWLVALCGIDE